MLIGRLSHLPRIALAAMWIVLLSSPAHAVSGATAGKQASPWEVINVNMKDSLAAYRKGENETAYMLAATAYLDGFELLEDQLKEVDYDLMKTIEQGMAQMRNLMRQGAPLNVVENQNTFVENLLGQARDALEPEKGKQ
jgi:high-affinity iron transporter